MAHDPPEAQNGTTPPKRPAPGPLGDAPDGQAPTAPRATGRRFNIIPRTETTPDDLAVVAICPYCQTDLSSVSQGRYVATPEGMHIEVTFPVACPECHHPLLFLRPSRIIPARGLPRA